MITESSGRMRVNGKDTSCNIMRRTTSLPSKKSSTSQREAGIPRPRQTPAQSRATGPRNKTSSSNSKIPTTVMVPRPRTSAGPGDAHRLTKGTRFGRNESKLAPPVSSPNSVLQGPGRTSRTKISGKNAINKRVIAGSEASPISPSGSEKDSTYSYIPASPSVTSDSSSEILDIERTDFWVSLINLDREDSHWISDAESENNSFLSGFVSPTRKSKSTSELQTCSSASSFTELKYANSQYSLTSDDISESAEWEDFSNDDPIFWPLQQKFDRNSGKNCDLFCVSPSKKIFNTTCRIIKEIGNSDKEPPDSVESNLDLKVTGPYGRRLALGSGALASKIIEWERKIAINMIDTITKPSQLSKYIEDADAIVPPDDIMEPTDENVEMQKLVVAERMFWEEVLHWNEINLIETLVGLSEFDGHEGIDLEANLDVLLLD